MGVILRKRSYCHEFYVIIKDSEKLQRLSLQHYFSLKINWKLKCVKIKDILILLRVKDYRECMPYPHNIIKITKKSSQKFEGRKKKIVGNVIYLTQAQQRGSTELKLLPEDPQINKIISYNDHKKKKHK